MSIPGLQGPEELLSGSFVWAVGIEDTFVGQPHRRTGRVLDEYELTDHYRLWREDLALVASLGVQMIRYGIPWYRVNPAPGVYDWAWTDEVLEHLVRDLRIQPIVDLMHYGCPLWLEGEFASPEYPERVAEYAQAFVERYRGLVRYYTPLNESLVNANFCGQTGLWPPYLHGTRGWVRVLMALVRGMARTIPAICSAQPEATIVHVEAASYYAAEDPSLASELQFRWRRQFLPADLLLGRVDGAHPLYPWLLSQGVAPEELDWLLTHRQDFHVFGCNFYPGISCWRVVRTPGGTGIKRYYAGATELEAVVRAFHERYGKPVMLTETSTPGAVWRRERWLDTSVSATSRLRSDGVPVVGYTWWPVFSLVDWSYR
ncbi:MAG: family 1 glycosylhydrolase, partial [Chloroflexota bacterium]|nr:family 1 glycosylhydrolase [Chloroflexota bacterium]